MNEHLEKQDGHEAAEIRALVAELSRVLAGKPLAACLSAICVVFGDVISISSDTPARAQNGVTLAARHMRGAIRARWELLTPARVDRSLQDTGSGRTGGPH